MWKRSIGVSLAILLFWISGAFAGTWNAGDRVQVYVDGVWWDATVLGPGPYEKYYSVQFATDGSTSSAREDAIRAAPQTNEQPPTNDVATGDYTCVGYGNADFRWYLRISPGGAYQQLTPDLPPGHFGFVPERLAIMFVDGPYQDNGWFGKVATDIAGRHQIVLRSIASEQKGPRVDEYANIYCDLGG